MARLVVVTSELAGYAHDLGAGWTTIGRTEGNAFKLSESSVSSQHCEVRLQGDELLIRDLCSTNGTFFQGRKISETTLKSGQTFRVGEVDLRFEAPEVPPSSAAPAPFSNTMLVGAKAKPPAPGAAAAARPVEPPHRNGHPVKRYQVLFVDDSLAFIETLAELCSVLAGETWAVHSVTSADEALALLQRTPIDLVVLDIVMPMVDGIQILGIIRRRYPGIRIAILTGKASESNRAACLVSGAELFIEKPISEDGGKGVFNLLNELVSWENREGFSGILREVGLQDVIQMECIGRRSSILEVRNQNLLGEIYIETGAIIHASAGTVIGGTALNQLLSLTGGEFRMKPFKQPPRQTVQAPWEYLLMEAARCRDEGTALLPRDSSDTQTSIKPALPETEPRSPSDSHPNSNSQPISHSHPELALPPLPALALAAAPASAPEPDTTLTPAAALALGPVPAAAPTPALAAGHDTVLVPTSTAVPAPAPVGPAPANPVPAPTPTPTLTPREPLVETQAHSGTQNGKGIANDTEADGGKHGDGDNHEVTATNDDLENESGSEYADESAIENGKQYTEPDDEFVVVATYDGQWNPVTGSRE